MNDIKVSICCITYNQGKYIKQAIERFLMQKTDFKYEIIINDDCSTDNTIEILKEYEEKYPNIIKVLFEKENRYSKGCNRLFSNVFNEANGKYIAICEGDDFWIDEKKLQKQYDFLEKNEDYNLYIHNAYIWDDLEKTDKKVVNINKWLKKNEYEKMNAGQMMSIDYSGNFPTASMFFRKKSIDNFPNFYYFGTEDMALKLLVAENKYVYYDDNCLSAYRKNTGISMMDSWKKEKKEATLKRIDKILQLYKEYNIYTNNSYEIDINKCAIRHKIDGLLIENKLDEIFNKNNSKIYRKCFNDKFMIKIFIKRYFPWVVNFLKGSKNGKK